MEWVNGILKAFSNYPDVAAALLGLALSWSATQTIKKMLPDTWSDAKYRHAVQIVGFVSGWAFTAGAWRLLDPSAGHFERFYYSAGMGFASPALYSAIIPYIATKFPRVGKALSGRPSDNA